MIQNKEAHRRLIAARTTMVLDQPFWGMLSSKLRLVEDAKCKTAWTDGTQIGYNSTFILSLTSRQCIALMSHETEHCTRGHPWRRGGRDHKQFNIAADLSINADLRSCGFALPDGALFPEQYGLPEGKSAEWYYERVQAQQQDKQKQGGSGAGEKQEKEEQGGGAGDSQDDCEQEDQQGADDGPPDPLGEVRDAPRSSEKEDSEDGAAADEPNLTEEDWRQAVIQAAQIAQGQGKLPAGLERLIEAAKNPIVDWRPIMRRFAQESASADYSWRRPNRRFRSIGMYMPEMHSREVGVIAIGVDTSGSIDEVLLAQFEAEVQAIAEEVQPRRIVVFYSDAKVHRTDVFEKYEPVKLHPAGGGGTDFRPVFQAIEEMDEQPVCVIYLTDLYGTFPDSDPGIPTLWVTGQESTIKPPFGELLAAA